MNRELLNTLSCPACRGELDLKVTQEGDDPANACDGPRSGDDVFTGLLKCGCGRTYPVLEGVPRLLESESRAFFEFEDNLKREVTTTGRRLQYARSPQSANDVESIRRSFSEEWRLFDYASDKTWGWTLEERKRVFLDDVALTAHQVKDARLLDAGCGNGTLTASLGALAREVIGIDLNDGLGMANRNRARYDCEHWRKVQFVQGDLCQPPLKSESFDLIYCSGVIHHTPNSRETFEKLVPLVKKGGRLYVWVYGDRNLLVRLFVGSGRQLKRVMSLHSLSITCRFLAPLYRKGTELLAAFGLMKFRKRSVREITLDLFDAFAPRYNHCHSEEEVMDWFSEARFTNITVSGRQKHGFGVYGDKM